MKSREVLKLSHDKKKGQTKWLDINLEKNNRKLKIIFLITNRNVSGLRNKLIPNMGDTGNKV